MKWKMEKYDQNFEKYQIMSLENVPVEPHSPSSTCQQSLASSTALLTEEGPHESHGYRAVV
jgi:hypothetical protein